MFFKIGIKATTRNETYVNSGCSESTKVSHFHDNVGNTFGVYFALAD